MDERPVLVLGLDPLSSSLAGPGWRLRSIAPRLARSHAVEIWTPAPFAWGEAAQSEGWRWRELESTALLRALKTARAVVAPPGLLGRRALFTALRRGCPMAFDCFVPGPVEAPHYFAALGGRRGRKGLARHLDSLAWSLAAGDRFLHAGARQRRFWQDRLVAAGRRDPDELLLSLPFGIEAQRIPRKGSWLREKIPELPSDRPIVLWGGGIWDWLDPETLLNAVGRLQEDEHPPLLLFPGTRHPNPSVPPMKRVGRLRMLAERSGSLNRSVFFVDGWASREGREDYLSRASVGAVLSADVEEAAASFRIRILDYVWAELPVLCTEGDELADAVAREGWGEVVPMADVEATARALRALLDPATAKACKAALRASREEWSWERVMEPISAWLKAPRQASDRPGAWSWLLGTLGRSGSR